MGSSYIFFLSSSLIISDKPVLEKPQKLLREVT